MWRFRGFEPLDGSSNLNREILFTWPSLFCGLFWLGVGRGGDAALDGCGVSWISFFVYIVARDFGMNGIHSERFWGSFRCFAVFPYVGRMTPPPPSCGFFVAWMREGVSGFGVDCGGFFGWWRKVLEGFSGRLRRRLAELLVVSSNPTMNGKLFNPILGVMLPEFLRGLVPSIPSPDRTRLLRYSQFQSTLPVGRIQGTPQMTGQYY